MGRVNEALKRAAGRPQVPDHGAEPADAVEIPALDEAGPGADWALSAAVPVPDDGVDVRLEADDDAPAAVESSCGRPVLEQLGASLAEKTVVDPRTMPASREQYRRLAATLHRVQAASGLKVVMIASAAAGEGKTLTACNLALTLSESYGRRVLLIDADLRRPTLHQIFGFDSPTGLADGLASDRDEKLPLRPITAMLTVLPGGAARTDPMAGLTSTRMRRVLDESREAFDWVIVDTPPVGLMPDANLLAAMVDGVLLVVKAGSTPFDLVRRSAESLGESGQLLGVVLNRATQLDRRGDYGYQAYARYYAQASQEPRHAP